VEQEAADRRAEAERRRALDKKATALVDEILRESTAAARLRSLLAMIGKPAPDHPRTTAFIRWAEEQLAIAEARLASEALEGRLREADLFDSDQSEGTCSPVTPSPSRQGSVVR
jgi:hypothetical protein